MKHLLNLITPLQRWLAGVAALLAAGSLMLPLVAQSQVVCCGGGGGLVGYVSYYGVAPVTTQASFSQSGAGLYAMAGYELKVSNGGGAPITATFSGTLSNAKSGQVGTFYNNTYTESSNCVVGSTTAKVTCSLSVPAYSTVTRVVYYRTPNKSSTNTLQPGGAGCSNTSGDCLTFTGTLSVTASASQQGYNTTTTTFVGLGSVTTTSFYTAVPSKGLDLWTGVGKLGASSTSDTATTRVKVPATTMTVNGAAGYTSAALFEAAYTANDPVCTNFKACTKTDITIPVPQAATKRLDDGSSGFNTALQIALKRNRGNAVTTNINMVQLYYTPDGRTDLVQLGACPSSTVALTTGIPCIASRVSSTSEFTFNLLNFKNGKYWVN